MATTAVFIEILLVGIQAVIWMALLALIVVGPGEVAAWDWEQIQSWAGLLSFAALGMAYAAGVIVDRLADSLFDLYIGPLVCKKERARRKADKEQEQEEQAAEAAGREPSPRTGASSGEKRLLVRQYGGDMTTFLDYVRSRVRIARSTALNLAMVTVLATVLVPGADLKVLVAAIGVVSTGLTVFAWKRINLTWRERQDQAYRFAKEAADKEA